MRIAIIGCGFVADLYLQTLKLHPELELAGVYDRDGAKADAFAKHFGTTTYPTLDAVLSDASVSIVANLTNPSSHYEISRKILESGKHAYSEKPLATKFAEAEELVRLADELGLQIVSAPCSLLGESAQTLGKAIRDGHIGKIRGIYAEMDDGLVHLMPFKKWYSSAGAPWPWEDEFRVGCTQEHAGYCLTWLCGFFGPVRRVTAFASVQVPDKAPDAIPAGEMAADFSVACLEFDDGIMARLTCSLVGPHDHHLRFFGDKGEMWVKDTWFYRSAVYVRKFIKIRRRMLLNPFKTKLPMQGKHLPVATYGGASSMDFCRGISELAEAVEAGRAARLGGNFSLHITELTLAIDGTERGLGGVANYEPRSTFDPVPPMPWAE